MSTTVDTSSPRRGARKEPSSSSWPALSALSRPSTGCRLELCRTYRCPDPALGRPVAWVSWRNMPSKDPASPNADHDGYVPFGKLVNYAAGRSDGCTSWSPSDARQIIPMVEGRSDNALHLSGVPRHRRRSASGCGRPVAITRRAILERLVLERNWLAEILAKRDTRADPCPIQGGASRPAAAAGADLQGAVKFIFAI